MSLQELFVKAVEDIKVLKQQPNSDELLEIYALYKQATVGNVNTASPGFFDIKAKAKWSAWNNKKDLDGDVAKQQYVDKVHSLVAKIGTN